MKGNNHVAMMAALLLLVVMWTTTSLQMLCASALLFPRDSETREVKELSGIWRFRADAHDDGFKVGKEWYRTRLDLSGDVIDMPVPSSFNDISQDKSLRDFVGWVWYERDVYVPMSWMSSISSRKIMLRFESAHYQAKVYWNGKFLVEHIGGHLPFEVDVVSSVIESTANGTAASAASNHHRITVALNNELTRTTLPPGSVKTGGPGFPKGVRRQVLHFDFFNYAGLHRRVMLYTKPRTSIDDITITTDYDEAKNIATIGYKVDVVESADSSSSRSSLRTELFDKEGKVVLMSDDSSDEDDCFQSEMKLHEPQLWFPVSMSPSPAYLYTLRFELRRTMLDDDHDRPTIVVDVYRLRIGIRTVQVSNDNSSSSSFLINGRAFYFSGVGKHEDANIRGKGLDLPTMIRDFNLLNWMNANSFRTSHYPYASEVLDMCDERGIVVIAESPGVGIQRQNMGDESLQHHRKVMKEMVARDKNHASVVMWSLANEPSTDVIEATHYFSSLFNLTRSLDSTRLVTFVTAKDFNTDLVAEMADVICINRYYGWYTDSGHTETIVEELSNDLENWYQRHRKPMIITEMMSRYGADTLEGLHNLPSGMFSEEYQVEFLQQYHRVFDNYSSRFLVGEMVWNFADFMTGQGDTRVNGNRKGVFTRERQPKMAAHLIRFRYKSLLAASSATFQEDTAAAASADSSPASEEGTAFVDVDWSFLVQAR